jgi:hypothetical protein
MGQSDWSFVSRFLTPCAHDIACNWPTEAHVLQWFLEYVPGSGIPEEA